MLRDSSIVKRISNTGTAMGTKYHSMDNDMFILPDDIEASLRNLIKRYVNEAKREYESLPKKEQRGHVYDDLFLLRAWVSCPTGILRFPGFDQKTEVGEKAGDDSRKGDGEKAGS
jgi:hypothetical protein